MAEAAYKVYRIRLRPRRREANLALNVASEKNRRTSLREAALRGLLTLRVW